MDVLHKIEQLLFLYQVIKILHSHVILKVKMISSKKLHKFCISDQSRKIHKFVNFRH